MHSPSLKNENSAVPETFNPSRGQFLSTLRELATFDNLLYAYQCAVKHKKHRTKVFKYADNLGENLLKLQRRILDGTYSPKPCYNFEIFCTCGQKVRQISAPKFEDTIVQNLIYQNIYDYFDRKFIFDSYGCRRGKGTHKAEDRLQRFVREVDQNAYILQLDIRKYYYNIDHSILREILQRFVYDEELVDTMMEFCKNENNIGLNVGCLMSQLFGLIYLNRFDHWVKRNLKIKHYIRYVDDMVFILPNRKLAETVLQKCSEFLKTKLHLSLSKFKIMPIKNGVNFVGFRTKQNGRRIRRRSVISFKRALRKRKFNSLISILGHTMHSNDYYRCINTLNANLSESEKQKLPKRFREELV